jgi:hypothetical protein
MPREDLAQALAVSETREAGYREQRVPLFNDSYSHGGSGIFLTIKAFDALIPRFPL